MTCKKFSEQHKVGRINKFWKQASLLVVSDGIRSLHACSTLWRPHLRQTHVVLIHCTRVDSFTLSASLPLCKTHLCLFIHPISLVFAPTPASLTAITFPFHISHVPCQHLLLHCFTFFFNSPDFLLNTSAISLKSLKYFPTGALQPCHRRMYDLPLTSRCFERVMPKTSLSSPEIWDFVCVS